ncbi:hypothetical protein [Teichococcus vastitatis]|jgi:hypothetical protein|uniref:TcpE family protein n=1 Tax=Teichococcus vastitatis TaxID=2307076 RepID=A0ABS9WBV7_9PROT|nr:hypothetical protein [Pseudoroseomonas vastitatis]MCI0756716.1 hypothetical protein [Pseudoroseomonas vastitatis]
MNEFQLLQQQIDTKRIQLGIHIRKMNTPGSPVYRYSENIPWPFALITVAIGGMLLVNIHVGMALMSAGIVWWLWKVQPRVKDKVFHRSAALALSDERLFDGLWAKGALTLYVERPNGERHAATRKHDWRAFVRDRAAEDGASAGAG